MQCQLGGDLAAGQRPVGRGPYHDPRRLPAHRRLGDPQQSPFASSQRIDKVTGSRKMTSDSRHHCGRGQVRLGHPNGRPRARHHRDAKPILYPANHDIDLWGWQRRVFLEDLCGETPAQPGHRLSQLAGGQASCAGGRRAADQLPDIAPNQVLDRVGHSLVLRESADLLPQPVDQRLRAEPSTP